MSEGYARLELTKGNKMNKNELAELVAEMETVALVDLIGVKTGFDTLGSYAYALSLFWNLADDKLKNKIVNLIEENN
jgi:hypothetical protein